MREYGYFDAPRIAVIGHHRNGQSDGTSYYVGLRRGKPMLKENPALREEILTELRRVAHVIFAPYEARYGQPEKEGR